MPGMVTVFNCFNEPLYNLLVAGNDAGSIAGWSAGPTPPLFTPSSTTVPRAEAPQGTAVFTSGPNTMAIPWASGTGTVTIDIPTGTSLDDDLILYVTWNQAILINARGGVISTAPVTINLFTGDLADAAAGGGGS